MATPHNLNSSWYKPGKWKLPDWWLNGDNGRKGILTYSEQKAFYSGSFCRNVLNHSGGITTLPKLED